jgi:hypothetical protein
MSSRRPRPSGTFSVANPSSRSTSTDKQPLRPRPPLKPSAAPVAAEVERDPLLAAAASASRILPGGTCIAAAARRVNPNIVSLLNNPVIAPGMQKDGTAVFLAKDHERLSSVNIFQKACRRYLHLLTSSQQLQAVIRIQRWFRCFAHNRIAEMLAGRYEEVSKRAARLGRWWLWRTRRRMEAARKVKEAAAVEMADLAASAHCMQRCWRAYAARAKVAEMRRVRQASERNLALTERRTSAATAIQKHWRRHAAEHRTGFSRRAIKRTRDKRIVNTIRSHFQRKRSLEVQHQVMAAENAAAARVQRWWRRQQLERARLLSERRTLQFRVQAIQ